jgi:hypothetical protein
MDNFHGYLKKQLLTYIDAERKKGIPLEQIEKVLLDAGHNKNIIDEVVSDLKQEQTGKKVEPTSPVENDLASMLKKGLGQFLAQAKTSEIKEAKEELKNGESAEIIAEAIDEAEVIEEKTMFESLAFFIYLVILGGIIFFSAGSTGSEFTKVIIGFAPGILSVFISFLALKLADMVPVYVFIPVIISSVFYGVGKYTKLGFFDGLDIEGLAIVNFLLGFIFCIIVVYIRFLKPNHMKKRIIKKNNLKLQDIPQRMQPNNSSDAGNIPHKKKEEISDLKREFNL